jgi:thiol-disulfide isomerase/thioredoxin
MDHVNGLDVPGSRHQVSVLKIEMRRITLPIAMLMILAAAAHSQTLRPPSSVTLRDIHGRTVRLDSYKGKVVLLNFWATWCPPCRAEMPDLVRMQRQYRGRGLQVIGITYPPEQIEEIRRFIRKLRINYPIALGTKETKALFDEEETLPLTVVIDRQGNVRDRIKGILLPEEFEGKIKPLLR